MQQYIMVHVEETYEPGALHILGSNGPSNVAIPLVEDIQRYNNP